MCFSASGLDPCLLQTHRAYRGQIIYLQVHLSDTNINVYLSYAHLNQTWLTTISEALLLQHLYCKRGKADCGAQSSQRPSSLSGQEPGDWPDAHRQVESPLQPGLPGPVSEPAGLWPSKGNLSACSLSGAWRMGLSGLQWLFYFPYQWLAVNL